MFCFFHALLCLLSFKSFLWSALCLPLSVSLVPSWSAPLCSSPSFTSGFLPPRSPHLFLVMSLVSLYLVRVFPSLLVRSLSWFVFGWSCSWSCSCSLFGMFWIFFCIFFPMFDLNFVFLLCYFFVCPHLSAFGFCNQLLLNKSLPFFSPDLVSCVTAFESTSPSIVFPLNPLT